MKKLYFLIAVFFLIISCASKTTQLHNETTESMIEFTEERRLNHSVNFPEVTIVNSMNELLEIYNLLKDPNFPSSAPIPTFDAATETMVVIKPQIKELEFADIEIQKVELIKSKLIIQYKEIEDWEFTENQWKNPLVIIKVQGKPTEIILKNR